MQGIGIGVSDFKMLRVRDNYFIDKSLFIKHIIDNQSSVASITRPRRFGKTLNMSMLKYYFDITAKDSKELFEGLKIMEQGEKYTSKLGAYPCIYCTLKNAKGQTYEEMLLLINKEIAKVFSNFTEILKSKKMLDIEKEMFNRILKLEANEVEISNSIKFLMRLLNNEYEKPVILLLDEYDEPLQTEYVKSYYKKAINFFKRFFSITVKDNIYLEKAVLTGVEQVTKADMFSRSKQHY